MQKIIEYLLNQALDKLAMQEGFSVSPLSNITIERPRNPEHGDFSSNMAMVLAKSVGLPPRILATKLIACIPSHDDIARVKLAGPGFINMTLSQQYLLSQLNKIYRSPTCGVLPADHLKVTVVDYSSPNLAKEMHVGHLRSTIIGDALARVLEFKGHHVIRQNHVGDWGTQFGMLLAHLEDQEQHDGFDMQLRDLEAFYKASKQRFDVDPLFAERARKNVVLLQSGNKRCHEMWARFIKISLAHCQEVYDRLGVTLQPSDVRAESAYNESLLGVIDALSKKGLLVQAQGAQCVFLDEFKGKNDEPLPIIVRKSDGGFLYATTDLAAISYRQNVLKAERILYVVDRRQALHLQQVFLLSQRADFASPSLSLLHISFGMVLDKSGKPFKSREGGVTKLTDLLDEAIARAKALILSKQSEPYSDADLLELATTIGISAIKYADLSKNRLTDYVFDWDSMLSFEGNTAPYLLYAVTRIRSLFLKAEESSEGITGDLILKEPAELTLARQLMLFPEVIESVVTHATPHLLCGYLFDLAQSFSSFYEACPILSQKNMNLRKSRLQLAAITAQILEQGLFLLGIKTVKRM
ncbi:MAG: arginine--tRNA ligase [Legionellales bacterium]|nr:arginine--tRNA ligase [Legionellales bacterium]